MKLEGKSVVVTGASAGMGQAIVELFAAEGANVIAVARRAERLEALAETLASWTSGRTTIPREAFIILLETDNINHRRTQERFDQIAATVERLKKQ